MATVDSLNKLRERIRRGAHASQWQTPDDLSRLSVEAFVSQRSTGRVLRSSGELRLTGAGVRGHEASLPAVASVMSALQRLVDAMGAAVEGVYTGAGKLPETIRKRTRLQLNADPQPGSLRLVFSPNCDVFEELGNDTPMVMNGNDERMLADRAFEGLISLLAQGADDVPVADSFSADVRKRGPRVASALKAYADTLVRGDFTTDLVWKEPEHPTRRVTTTSADAARISSIIDGRDLDEEPATVEGTLIGIFRERRVALVIDLDYEEGVVQILRGDLQDTDIDSLHTGSRVRVQVIEKTRVSAGGETSTARRACGVEILNA